MTQFSTAALAAAAGLDADAVAEYRRRGLLPAPSGREPGFGREHVDRARLLSRLAATGMNPDVVERLVVDRALGAERLLELRALVLEASPAQPAVASVRDLVERFGDFGGQVLDQAIKARLLAVRDDGLIDIPSPALLDVAERAVAAGLSLSSAVQIAAVVRRACLGAAGEILRFVLAELWTPLEHDELSDARLRLVADQLHQLRALATSVFEATLPNVITEVFDKTFADELGLPPGMGRPDHPGPAT